MSSQSPRLPLLSTQQPRRSSGSRERASPTSINSAGTTSTTSASGGDALFFHAGPSSSSSSRSNSGALTAEPGTMDTASSQVRGGSGRHAPIRHTQQRRRQSTNTHISGMATPEIGDENKGMFQRGEYYIHDDGADGDDGYDNKQRGRNEGGKRGDNGERGGADDDDGDDDDDDDDDLVAIEGHDGARSARDNDGDDDGDDNGYRPVRGMAGSATDYTSHAAQRRAFWSKAVVNLSLIGSWYCFSTLMNLYNSWLFSKKHYHFSYPLFVTSIHMVVQFGLSSAIMFFFASNPRIVPRRRNGKRARPDGRDWLSKVVPCALATALDIGLSNLSLKTITLTFYTMCKSSNLAFVLFFAFLFGLEKLRLSLIGIIALITVGVIMMVAAETQFVLEGAVEVLTASAMGGLRWALTQLLLDRENIGMNNPIATIFWLSPVMAIAMFCVSLIVEDWPTMVNGPFFDGLSRSLKTVLLMVVPGFIAFCMNLSEFALIQRTSVVTLSVAGIFKEVLTIFVSSTIFGDELTAINVTGLCVALTGIGLYNWLKYRILTGRIHDGSPGGLATMTAADRGAGYTHLAGEPSSSSVAAAATSFFKGRRRGREPGQRAGDENGEENDVLFDDEQQAGSGAPSSLAMSERDEASSTRNTSPATRSHSHHHPLSEAERQRLAKREEEADLFGWEHSGTTTTGNGYVEGSDTE